MASVLSEIVTGMVLELEMVSGMPLESKVNGKFVSRRSTMFDWLLCTFVYLSFETDVIAALEERWADWKNGYHYAKDYDVTCLFCS